MGRKPKINKEKLAVFVKEGKSLSWIAEKFGVTSAAVVMAINRNEDIKNEYAKRRKNMAKLVEHSAFECATGFFVDVPKTVKLKRIEYENGKKVREYEELAEYTEKVYIKPDVAAQIFLLKNWAGYMNEPKTIEIRKQELELHKKKLESEVW